MLAAQTTPWITPEVISGARVEPCAGPFFHSY